MVNKATGYGESYSPPVSCDDCDQISVTGAFRAASTTKNTFSDSVGVSAIGEIIFHVCWDNRAAFQLSSTGSKIGYRRKNGGAWGPWKQLATTEPPQEYDLPLGPNVSSQSVKYFKDGCGKVGVNGVFSFNAAPSAAQLIGTLPMGFRPSSSKSIILQSDKNDSMYGYIHSNGQIVLANTTPAQGFTVGRQIAIVASLFIAI